MKISILICALEERKEQQEKLISNLIKQGRDGGFDVGFIVIDSRKIGAVSKENYPPKDVEIIMQIDAGEQTVAAKRNDLLVRAQGDYICYIDDDDDVPDYYIAEILKAITPEQGEEWDEEIQQYVKKDKGFVPPDVIGFKGRYFISDKEQKPFLHSRRFQGWFEDANAYCRCPNNLNPVKRSIALKVGFRESLRSVEDLDYSMRLKPLLKTEVFIDKPMYLYRYVPKKSRGTLSKNRKPQEETVKTNG